MRRVAVGDLLVVGLATLLAALLLGPALLPGYVLVYDMVWVPDLALRADFLGTGSSLPRAVPSDAVVAVLDEVVPGMLLQKLVLLGSLVAAGVGAAHLLRDLGTAARLVGLTVAVWNPFVVERLWLGHWTILLAYAISPWLLAVAARARHGGVLPPSLAFLALVGSLSPGAGLATGTVALAAGLRRGAAGLRLLLLVAAVNAPWIVAGLLRGSDATSSAAAAEAFGTRAEGDLGTVATVLGLGGIWNEEVVPPSRESPAAFLGLLVLALLVVAGARAWWRHPGPAGRRGPLSAAAVGWGLALSSAWAPGVLGWLAASVPGGGLVRDGSRFLGLCAPLLVLLVGHGVATVGARVRDPAARGLVAGVCCLLFVASLPDAAWGGLGRLRAVDYPVAWEHARNAVGDGGGDDVLVLPFSSYRAPSWNGRRKVLDPLGRYLEPDFVASDELYVADERIAGEDPRARRVGKVLRSGAAPEELARRLAVLGVGVVVTDRDSGGRPIGLPGQGKRFGSLVVTELSGVERSAAGRSEVLLMALAWGAWAAAPLTLLALRRRRPGARPRDSARNRLSG